MAGSLDRLIAVILDLGLAATLLLGLTTLAMLCLRQPSHRLALARASLVGSLALIPLIGFGLAPRVNVGNLLQGAGFWPDSFLRPNPGAWVVELAGGAGFLLAPDTAAALSRWLLRGLIALYLFGVAYILACLGLGTLLLGVIGHAAAAPSLASVHLYESLPFPEGRRRPDFRVASRAKRPALVGIFRPLILIPPELDLRDDDLQSRETLRLCLLHELSHAATRDMAFGLLANLAHACWHVLPPHWWIARQMKLDQEFLADRRAAFGFGSATQYASSLLGLASNSGEALSAPVSGSPISAPRAESQLGLRVLMLLRCPFAVELRPSTWSACGVSFLVGLMTLGASCLAFRLPEASSPSPSSPRTFQMASLELSANATGLTSLAPGFELPIRLPDSFVLSLEVWGDLATLARSRVVGLPLIPDTLASTVSPRSDLPKWHQVRVRRGEQGVELWIDDAPSPFVAEPGQSMFPSLKLSLEPAPLTPGHYRNLTLSW